MALHLYPGCDVWLNNPLRPFEACGTSGMKAALNGALNLSILDGWWDEWFDGKNGWAIPTADGVERPRPARRHRGQGALRPRRAPGRAAVLRHRRGRPAAELAGDDAAHGHHARRPRCGPAGWCATTPRSSTCPPPGRAGRSRRGDYAGARDLAAYKAKARGAWGDVHVDHVESSGVGDSPELGETLHVTRLRLARRAHPRRRRGAGRARPHQPPRRPAARRVVGCRWRTSSPTSTVATSSPATCCCGPRERSATPCGCCPSTTGWPARASSAWSPTPEAYVTSDNRSRVTSARVRHPVSAIVRSSSARMLRSTSATPSAPASARP